MMYTNIVHRTQVLLEERQYRALMSLARRTGKGLSALVRDAVDGLLGAGKKTGSGVTDIAGIGRGKGGFSGADHDEVLYGKKAP